MERRGFLKAILAAGIAPAFIPVERLMRIKPIVVPPKPDIVLYMRRNFEGDWVEIGRCKKSDGTLIFHEPIQVPAGAFLEARVEPPLKTTRSMMRVMVGAEPTPENFSTMMEWMVA